MLFDLKDKGINMIFIKDLASKGPRKNQRGLVQARHVYPVLNPEELLSDPKRKLFLKKIEDLCGLQKPFFELLYQQLVHDFVRYVQILPTIPGGKIGGLMDDSLERAVIALQFCKQDPERQDDTLFAYAAFTAALFDDVGRVLTQQKVFLSDSHGNYLDEWNPLKGFLGNFGDYYKVRSLGVSWVNLSHFVAPTIARQLMPEAGYLWIAEDFYIYQMWLAVLIGDTANGGALLNLLQLVEVKIEELRQKGVELGPVEIDHTNPPETELAEDFIEWLGEGIEKDQIQVNKAGSDVNIVSYTDQQEAFILFNYPELFQQFSERNGIGDWRTVEKQFNNVLPENYREVVTFNAAEKEKTKRLSEAKSFFLQQNQNKTSDRVFQLDKPKSWIAVPVSLVAVSTSQVTKSLSFGSNAAGALNSNKAQTREQALTRIIEGKEAAVEAQIQFSNSAPMA